MKITIAIETEAGENPRQKLMELLAGSSLSNAKDAAVDWTADEFASFWSKLQPDAQRILAVVATQPGGCPMEKVTEATGWTGLQIAGRLSSVGHALHQFKNRPYPYEWDKRTRTYTLLDRRYAEWVQKLANGHKPV